MENVFGNGVICSAEGCVGEIVGCVAESCPKELQVSISMKLERDLLAARPYFIVHLNTFISRHFPVKSMDSGEPTIKRAQSLFLLLYTSLRNINLFEQSCRLFSNCPFNFHFFHFLHLTARIEEQLHRIGELFLLFYISFSSLYRFFRFPCLPSLFVLFSSFYLLPPLTLPSLSVLPFHLLASGRYHYLRSGMLFLPLSISLNLLDFKSAQTYRYPARGLL